MQGIHVLNKVAPRVATWLRGEGDITVNDLNTSPSSDIKYTVNLIIRGVIGDVITLFTLTSLKLTLFTLFLILKTLYVIFVKMRHYFCQIRRYFYISL